jgi:type III restriction enzyme
MALLAAPPGLRSAIWPLQGSRRGEASHPLRTIAAVTSADLANPVLNGPYDPPTRYFEIGQQGPTNRVLDGRRPSESFIPIPAPKKGKKAKATDGEQVAIDYDLTNERVEANSLINEIRVRVELWRARGYPGVTPVTRNLLNHWADPTREDRVLFCQREAAETAIYLAEVAGRQGESDFRTRVADQNDAHNESLPRVGLKMATGAGKTIVMAMLIAWQSANKTFKPNDARFTKRFLVVTPGITIRDRLRVLQPSDDGNYYQERGLVPPDLWPSVLDAQIAITNYHAFLPREAKELKGVSATTKKLLRGDMGDAANAFKEAPEQTVSRVLRDLGGSGDIVVLNDEAHHCYRQRPLDDASAEDAEAKERNEEARVWYRGLRDIARSKGRRGRNGVGIKAIYDLSATPYYLGGSGYDEGFIFPWVVSDFSLMDAIESGIVKVPRVPVDDDAKTELVTYLRLWDNVGDQLPKKKGVKAASDPDWVIPEVLDGALQSLYRSYSNAFEYHQRELAPLGEPPPVLIVVCPNTIVSKLMYDWIAGMDVERDDGSTVARTGKLPLLSNVDNGEWLDRPRTILVDSAELESGGAMKDDFKKIAAREIDKFKQDYLRRNPGADAEKFTDEDLLREVMNTVGKKGMLGEAVRCVVSVSMLTEGWDANTVTHILGIRPFRSQLLCEQVVGRGLRRRDYVPDADGRFPPEYAEVYGVPFAFIPSDRPSTDPQPQRPAVLVQALVERHDLRITFPKLDGYRVEMPEQPLLFDVDNTERCVVRRTALPTTTTISGVVGSSEEHTLDHLRDKRTKELAFQLAKTLVERHFTKGDDQRRWLFPQLVAIANQWLHQLVDYEDECFPGLLLLGEQHHVAAEALAEVVLQAGEPAEILQPMLRRFDPVGSTDDVRFVTRKAVVPATKSHVDHVVLDGIKGNTWEQILAGLCEAHPRVAAFVKNEGLDFWIPYVHKGRTHQYKPDFLVRLVQPEDDPIERTLIIEVSGGQKSPGPTKAKADTARNQWCTAVNNHGEFGRWGYTEITDMLAAPHLLDEAIELLYRDAPIIGDPAV